jgi:tetratricopeptide (TPR) repeat protein
MSMTSSLEAQVAELEQKIKDMQAQVTLLESVQGPPGASAWMQAASRLKDAGKYDLAVKAWLEVIKLEPDNASAYNSAGVVLGKHLGDLDGAEQFYWKALDVKPDFYAAIYNLACTDARRGRRERAIALLAVAVLANDRYQQLATIDPAFEPYRDDAEVAGILGETSASVQVLLRQIGR